MIYKKLKRKKCPHIAYVYDICENEGKYYVTEEYVSGLTAKEYIEKHGVMSHLEVSKVIYDICDAMTFVHSKGIIHRDINPNNIIITNNLKSKVIDFGISRIKKFGLNEDEY